MKREESLLHKTITFLREVYAELQKIIWPKRNELIGSTIIVCLLAIFFAVYLGVLDFGFGFVIKKLLA